MTAQALTQDIQSILNTRRQYIANGDHGKAADCLYSIGVQLWRIGDIPSDFSSESTLRWLLRYNYEV